MTGFLFRLWQQHFAKLQRQLHPPRSVRLWLEALEERVVMTQNVWLPQQLSPIAGSSQALQFGQTFQPVSTALLPPPGLSATVFTTSGNFSLLDQGSYDLVLHESGSSAAGNFSFSESGSVTFNLTVSGPVSNAGLAATSVVLTQSATLNWSLTQGGASSSGTTTLTTSSPGGTLDPFFAAGFSWLPVTQQLIQANGLGLGSASISTLSVGESGLECYTFGVSGQQTLVAGGVPASPDPLQGSTSSLGFARTDSFTLTDHGLDTYSLAEQGSANSSGVYSLNSILYAETANKPIHLADGTVALGATWQLTQSGTVTLTGKTSDSSTQAPGSADLALPSSIGALTAGAGQTPLTANALPQSDSDSFRFSDSVPYTYADGGRQSYVLRAAGTFGTRGFNLGSVNQQSSAHGSYTLGLRDRESSSGTFADTGSGLLDSNAGLLTSASDSDSGSFTQQSTLTQTEAGTSTLQLSEQGSYANGSLSLGYFKQTQTQTASTSSRQSDSYRDSYSGQFGQASLSEQFSGTDSSSDSSSQSGSAQQTLTEQGTLQGGQLNLSCWVVNAKSSGTFSTGTTASSTQSGTVRTSQTTTALATTAVGTVTITATSQVSFSSHSAWQQNSSGCFSQGTYTSGTVNSGVFALTSAAYQQSSNDHWTVSGSDGSTSSGTTGTVASGTLQTVSNNVPAAVTFRTSSTSTFASTEQDSYSGTGTDSGSARTAGAFAQGSFSFGQVAYSSSSNQTLTLTASGADTFSNLSSTSGSSVSHQGSIASVAGTGSTTVTGTFVSSGQTVSTSKGSDCWSLTSTSSAGVNLSQSGRFLAGSYSLGSVSLSQTGSDSWTSQQSGSGSGTSVYSLLSTGSNATAGLYTQTATGTITGAFTSSVQQSGTDSLTLRQGGNFAKGSFSFASVLFQAKSAQTTTATLAGVSHSQASTTTTYQTHSQQAGPVGPFGSGVGLASSTQTGRITATQHASETFSASLTSSIHAQVYQAGQAPKGVYGFGSVAYSESDTSATTSSDSQSGSGSGGNSWSAQTVSTWAKVPGSAQPYTGSGQSSASSSYSGTFRFSFLSSTNQHSHGSSSLTEQGSFSNGSYNFGCWVWDAGSSQQTTMTAALQSSFAGTGADSSVYSGSQSNLGTASTDSQSRSGQSSDCYASSGSQSASLVSTSSVHNHLHEAGGFTAGSYSLGSVNYTSSGSGSVVQAQSTVGSDSGSNSVSTLSSRLQTQLSSATPGYHNQLSSTSTQTSSGTFTDRYGSTNTISSSVSFGMSQQGAFSPTGDFSFASVVFHNGSTTTATQHSNAVSTSSSSQTSSLLSTALNASWGGSFSSSDGSSYESQSHLTVQSTSAQGSTALQQSSTSTSTSEVLTSGNQLWETGADVGGTYSYGSVVLSSTSSDLATVQQSGTSTQQGSNWASLDSSYLALSVGTSASGQSVTQVALTSCVAQSHGSASNSFTQSSLTSSTATSLSCSSLSQRGTLVGGSFAFGSTVYSNSGTARTTYAEHDTGNYTGSFHSSTDSTFLQQNTTGTFVAVYPSGNSKDISGQQWGSTNTTILNSQQQTFSLFQSGGVNLQGKYNLGSVVLTQTEQATSTVSSWGSGTQSSTSGTFSSNDVLWGYNLSQGLPGGVKIYVDQGGTVAFVQSSTRSSTETNQASSSLSQRGSFANGSYSFACVVYQSAQTGSDSSLQTGTQSYTQSSSSGQTFSNGTPILTSQNGYLSVSLKDSVRTGQETTSVNDVQTSSTSYYAAGSYSGGSNAYSLGSVNYQGRSSDLSTLVKEGGLTETGSQLTNQLNALATGVNSVWSNKLYQQTNSSTQTQVSQSNATLSELGCFSNGAFALDSVVLRQSGSTTTTTRQDSTNSSTQLTLKYFTFIAPSPLIAFYSATSTTTLHQHESDSSDDSVTSTVNLLEAGRYSQNSFALTSVVYDQGRQQTSTALQTLLSAETGTQLSLFSTTSNYNLTANAGTVTDTIATSLSSSSQSHLHEAGSLSSTGYFNLGCVSYSASGLSSYSSIETQNALSRQTTASVATMPANRSLLGALKVLLFPPLSLSSSSITALVTLGTLKSRISMTQSTSGLYSWTARESGSCGSSGYNLSSVVLQQTAVANQQIQTSSLLTSNSWVINSSQGSRTGQLVSQDTQSNTLANRLTIYQAGQISQGNWSLSSYQLTASSYNTASDALQQNGRNAVSVNSTTATGTMPNSYSGTNTTSLTQTTLQLLAANLKEKGSYSNGSLQLGLVSMTLDGSSTAGTRSTNNNSYTQGQDSITITASNSGSFHLQAAGSYSQSSLSLSSFQFKGQSGGTVAMTQTGTSAGVSYSHSDNWNENLSQRESGSYQPAAPGNAWNLTFFLLTDTETETASDQVKTSTASTSVTSLLTLVGTGVSGLSEVSSFGSNNWNGRYETFVTPTTTTNTPLIVIGVPQLNPTVGLSNLINGSVAGKASGVTAGALLGLVWPTTLTPLLGAGRTPPSAVPLLALQGPPLLSAVNPGPYGGWLSLAQGASGNPGPWTDLGQTAQKLWSLVNVTYQDGLTKVQSLLQNQYQNPLSMYASQQWSALTASLPAGTTLTSNLKAKLGKVVDYVAGIVDELTGGAISKGYLQYLKWLPFGIGQTYSFIEQNAPWLLPNPNSRAFQAGGVAGQVIGIVLMVNPSALGIVGRVLVNVQFYSGLVNASVALRRATGRALRCCCWVRSRRS